MLDSISIKTFRSCFVATLATGGCLLVLSGCHAPAVTAPRVKVESEAIRAFPRDNIRLTSNKIFLWPDHLAHEQVARVLELSNSMDALDKKSAQLNRERTEANDRVTRFQEVRRGKKKELNKKWNELNTANKARGSKRDEFQKELVQQRDAEAAEKAKGTPDPEILARLAQLIHEDEQKISDIEKEIASVRAEQKQIDEQVKKLDLIQDPQEVEAIRVRDEIQKKCDANDQVGKDQVQEIGQLVELFETQETVINFRFDDRGAPQVSISDWTLDRSEGKRSFSSEGEEGQTSSIRNIGYVENGGIFTFDVYVFDLADDGSGAADEPREIYSFKVERANYHAEDDRIYFSGEVSRKRFLADGSTETRVGIAKLINNSN